MLGCFFSLPVYSCDNDIQDENVVQQNLDNRDAVYLENFYSKAIKIGDSANIMLEQFNADVNQKSNQIDHYMISEVFVGNDLMARGYMFKNIDTNQNEIFVDVDRINFVLTSIDLVSSDVDIINNIDELPFYSTTNELDLLYSVDIDDPQLVSNGWRYQLVAGCHATYDGNGEITGFAETINVRRYFLGFIRTFKEDNVNVPCGTFNFLTN